MDFLKLYEEHQKIEQEKSNIKEKQDLYKIIGSIISGEEYCTVDNEELLKKIGIKYEERNSAYARDYFENSYATCLRFSVELTKSNIKKINIYYNKLKNKNEL